jgi:hypothetical protein
MKTRKRLYDYEAQMLGIEPRKPDPGKPNTRYTIKYDDWLKVLNIRTKRHVNPKRLFFDIETSPNIGYFWRAGYKLQISTESIIKERQIICISYKWEHSNEVHTLHWGKKQCDKKLLTKFMKVARQADELVGHNGDRFDLKWIRTRCLFHRISMFPKYRTFDTLKKARGSFNFNSNRLDYIAQFLGIGAKLKHSGYQLWKDVMLGCNDALKEMVAYCEKDVILLEDVFHAMQSYVTPNTHAGMHLNGHKMGCPTCASDDVSFLKTDFTARGTIQRMMECDSCETNFPVSNKVYTDYLKNKFAGLESIE